MNSFDESLTKKVIRYLKEEPDEALRSEIIALQNNPLVQDELRDRMNNYLCFGTAGLRGQMQAGYNRMNIVSVYRFAFALASQLENNPNKRVVVGYDARINSILFAEEVVAILSRFSLTPYLFGRSVPTPLCAFATKYLSASFGVMITASHNPGFDNGIKVFAMTSAQLHGDILKRIEKAMDDAPIRTEFLSKHGAPEKEFLPIGDEVIDAYFSQIRATSLCEKAELDAQVAIVYTPLHGVGRDYFLRALNEEGFSNIHVLEEQGEPDGHFPTVSFPNPEEENTLDLAHQKAKDIGCTWVFANDPDADRVQVSCLDDKGGFKKLTGNEMGSILGYFVIEKALKKGLKPLVVSSIVSSRMLSAIASQLGANYVDALTGFSNIANAALQAEKEFGSTFVFGYEEAIGFLVGKIVLDKDGINSAARFMEIAAYLKKQHLSVWDFLDQLYIRFGVFSSCQWSQRFAGLQSAVDMAIVMEKIRLISEQGIASLLGGTEWRKYDLIIPSDAGPYRGIRANVIIFEIKNRCRLIVRPSGTEPKIKFYLELVDRAGDVSSLKAKKASLSNELYDYRKKIENILAQVG
jgi:phosphomannomutase